MNPSRRALAFAAAFAFLWAVLEQVLGSRLQQEYDLRQVVWSRYATHLAVLVAIFAWREPALLWRTRRPVLQLGRSFLMLLMPLSFLHALLAGQSGHLVWAQFWITPVLLLALAAGMLGERVPVILWGCGAVAAAAAMAAAGPARAPNAAEILLPLSMTLSFCLYVVATRGLRHERLRANLFHTALVPFALLSFAMPWAWRTPTPHDALVLAGIGTVGLAALACLDRAIERGGVALVAPTLALQAGFVLLLSHGRPASALEWAIVACLVAVGLVSWRLAGDARVAAPDAALATGASR